MLQAINSLVVLFMYCYTECPRQGPWGGSWAQLGTAHSGSALAGAAWRPWSAPAPTWVCGILAHSHVCCPDQCHISSQGRLQGAFQRQFRQDAQGLMTDDEHSTRSGKSHPLCSASRDNSHPACDAGLSSLHQTILRWNISGRMDVVADALSR